MKNSKNFFFSQSINNFHHKYMMSQWLLNIQTQNNRIFNEHTAAVAADADAGGGVGTTKPKHTVYTA